MNRLNKTESAVFLYCRLALFLKDPFFQIIHRSNWRSGVRSAMRAASQLPGKGPLMWMIAPAPAH